MSRASTSAVRRAKAFLVPSGLMTSQLDSCNVSQARLPDQGVDFNSINIVKLLQGLFDLGLVGLDIDNEDKGVLLLDLLEGTLGVQGMDDDLVLIETRLVRDRLARVLGCP